MVDRYTRAVLTIIAAALCLLAWQSIQPSMQPRAQLVGCTPTAPCPVTLVGLGGASALPVAIANLPVAVLITNK